ncbi:MAG: hypothetical protein WA919_03470 [Coleofasciculaceae cyanobacterium]
MAKKNSQVSLSPELKQELQAIANQIGVPHPGIVISMLWSIYGEDFLQRFTTFNSSVVTSTSRKNKPQSPSTENYNSVVTSTSSNDDTQETTTDNGIPDWNSLISNA